MIVTKYDPTMAYPYVMYGRMSDPKQNKSSPDQQFREAVERISRLGYPWRELKRYRDDGISGRLLRHRHGFQDMLREIELEIVRPKLIVTDTIERFGRTEEVHEIRRKLFDSHGVLVVTANTNFADPTGMSGKAMGLVDNIRATEDGKTKAHNVVRGKKHAVDNGWWPGGAPPLGFKLRKVLDPSTARGYHSVAEPCPEILPLLVALFQRADESGHGTNRLAKWWNDNPAIPAGLKPISPTQVGYTLKNHLYVGRMIWGANNTDIRNDTHVRVANPDGPFADNPAFCEPVVPHALFQRVQEQRMLRSDAHAASQPDTAVSEKLIQPLGRGLSLVYLLAGLVRCALCKSALRTTKTRRTESGKVYEYVHHHCPRTGAGACTNRHYFREDKLRDVVIACLRAKLFPVPEAGDAVPEWLPSLLAAVEADLARACAEQPDLAAAQRAEMDALAAKMEGWKQSLGDPNLKGASRVAIQDWFAEAKAEWDRLEASLAGNAALAELKDKLLDPKEILKALQRLGDVLAASNPTLGNVELSKHIDRIDCHADGRVVLRGTTVGVLGDVALLLTRTTPPEDACAGDGLFPPIRVRDRTRRYVPDLSAQDDKVVDQTPLLAPDRFEGYAEDFFWEEEFFLERTVPWYEAAAEEVARERLGGKTHEELAALFDKTVPTIRAALKFAAKSNPGLLAQPKKMPRARWQDAHYQEVARLKANGVSVAAMAKIFEVSEPLIRAALKIAEANSATRGMDHPSTNAPEELAS